jgi:hypothetical protein
LTKLTARLSVKHKDHNPFLFCEIDDQIEKEINLPFPEVVSGDVRQELFFYDDVVLFTDETNNFEQ